MLNETTTLATTGAAGTLTGSSIVRLGAIGLVGYGIFAGVRWLVSDPKKTPEQLAAEAAAAPAAQPAPAQAACGSAASAAAPLYADPVMQAQYENALAAARGTQRVLFSDPIKQAQYDAEHQPAAAQPATGVENSGFESIFTSLASVISNLGATKAPEPVVPASPAADETVSSK